VGIYHGTGQNDFVVHPILCYASSGLPFVVLYIIFPMSILKFNCDLPFINIIVNVTYIELGDVYKLKHALLVACETWQIINGHQLLFETL